ncbi:hypothetical protein AB0M80_08360 [Amycolatopsis sp. NPDC051045]|uniref:hypothetical protein n=1 Tax=Amycolatopsis sp. NPDC051045 TaxID=3156922 RepID=UPI003422A1C6
MSAGEVAVRAVIGGVTAVAVVAAVVPYLRRDRGARAKFLDEPSNGRKSEGVFGDPHEFVADAGSVPPGPPHPSRSSAAAHKVALTGEIFARAGADIPERDHVNVWYHLTFESRPIRVAYWWATNFGKLFTLGVILFVASIFVMLGEYPPIFLITTLSVSVTLIGLPAVRLHRVTWQALNVAAGFYAVALKGAKNADE